MRIERSINTVSWIPSDLMEGMGKMATRMKLAHHDPPPPDSLGDDTARGDRGSLRMRDGFVSPTSCGRTSTWTTTARITDCGYCGGGVIGATTIGHGRRLDHDSGGQTARSHERARGRIRSSVKFTQTVGGRTGAPMPRAVKHAPFIQYHAPIVWTTLELTIHCRRHTRREHDRRIRVPASLGVRRRRSAHRQEQPRRVQAMDVGLIRPAHPLG